MEVAGIVVVIVLAILINGFIAKVEDDSPGGINNPDATWRDVLRRPKLHQIIIWAVGGVVILCLILMCFANASA